MDTTLLTEDPRGLPPGPRSFGRRYADIVVALTQKELRVRYKNYALGYLWSLAQPIAFACVFYFAFKVALRVPMEHYVFFLLAGLFPWQWMANSINASSSILRSNASIIKKVAFPRHAVVVSNVLQDALHFLLSVPIIAIVAVANDARPSPAWVLGIPLLTLLQMGIITGISLALSSLNIFFRDLERVTGLFTMMLFYFTPIVYSELQLPARLRPYLFLNPAAALTVAWRALFQGGALDGSALLWATGHAVVFLLIGGVIYNRLSPKFAEVL